MSEPNPGPGSRESSSPARAPDGRRRPARWVQGAAVFGSLALALIVAEVVVRSSGYRPTFLEPGMLVPLEDDLIQYGLRPRWSGIECGNHVTIDERGHRVVIRARAQPAASSRRILLLGDSVVFGFCLGNDETIATQLQARLDRSGVDTWVDNVAVPGYSTWNEVGALREYLQRSAVDQVVVLWVANDPLADLDPLGTRSEAFRLAGTDPAHRFLRWTYRHWTTSHLVVSSLRDLRRQPSEPEKRSATREELAHSIEGLQEIRRMALEREAGFSLGVYFGFSMVEKDARPSRQMRQVLSQMRESGLEPFAVTSHLRALTPAEVSVTLTDPHPSAKAVELIVEDIARELERAGVVGPLS